MIKSTSIQELPMKSVNRIVKKVATYSSNKIRMTQNEDLNIAYKILIGLQS